MYGLKIAKRPVRAKALIINAFALTGRIVFGGFLPQGVALGYVLLPLRGVLFVSFGAPSCLRKRLHAQYAIFILKKRQRIDINHNFAREKILITVVTKNNLL